MPRPVIEVSKCSNCNSCVELCPVEVFSKGEKHAEVSKPDSCIGCKACQAQCPQEAIEI